MSAYTQLMKWDGETRIPQMNLDQIKTMLCPMSGHDPLKCIDCKSVSTCQAGQRAVVLLDGETMGNRHKNNEYTIAKTLETRARAKKAIESGNPVQWIMDTTGVNRKAAVQRMRVWHDKYGDIVTDEVWEQCKKMKVEEKPKVDVKPDEVSIEDFLQDIEIQPETAQEAPSEPELEEMPIETKTEPESAKKAVFAQTVIGIELETKYRQIEARKEALKNEVQALEKELAWLEEQQEALEKVKNMFDQNTAIGRSLSMA